MRTCSAICTHRLTNSHANRHGRLTGRARGCAVGRVHRRDVYEIKMTPLVNILALYYDRSEQKVAGAKGDAESIFFAKRTCEHASSAACESSKQRRRANTADF